MNNKEQEILNKLSPADKELIEDMIKSNQLDQLTELPNRQAFAQRLKELSPSTLSIVSADANDLKKTNDSLGHSAGDILLISISDVLKQVFIKDIYRTGGDEFIILSEDMSKELLLKKIEEATELLAIKSKAYEELHISCSFGLAVGNGEKTIQELLNEADSSMYMHKKEYKHMQKEVQEIESEEKETEAWLFNNYQEKYRKTLVNYKKQCRKNRISPIILAGVLLFLLVIL